jgi:hypothetical protein
VRRSYFLSAALLRVCWCSILRTSFCLAEYAGGLRYGLLGNSNRRYWLLGNSSRRYGLLGNVWLRLRTDVPLRTTVYVGVRAIWAVAHISSASRHRGRTWRTPSRLTVGFNDPCLKKSNRAHRSNQNLLPHGSTSLIYISPNRSVLQRWKYRYTFRRVRLFVPCDFW